MSSFLKPDKYFPLACKIWSKIFQGLNLSKTIDDKTFGSVSDDYDKFAKCVSDANSSGCFMRSSDWHSIRDYYVEYFSWSVIPMETFGKICAFIKNYGRIVDPLCGNGFHAYILHTMYKMNVLASDIETAKFQWPVKIIKQDAMTVEFKNDDVLWLSWVDYESSVGFELLTKFKKVGNMCIVIGEGDGCCGDKKMHKELENNWTIVKSFGIPRFAGCNDNVSVYTKK